MSIYDFTAAELEEIRRADAEIERAEARRRKKTRKRYSPNWGGDRRSEHAHINHLGNPVWEFRVMHGLTQRALGKRLFISQQIISDMERGRVGISEYVLQWMRDHPEGR
jgi:ribosome-binding protein aMBF1 (putative translation factor)